ncbi:lytic transglycosylase domain-containing protein, partial [bacterium]|nr:lytic transglycosylase domain-containing protein [bacterium]
KAECAKYNLDPFFALAIMREDSRFDTGSLQLWDNSGLFRIKTPVLKDISTRVGETWSAGPQFMTPERTIKYGVFYLNWLRENFDGNLIHTILAYGTDPTSAAAIVRESRGNNQSAIAFMDRIPYSDTRQYIQRVIDSYIIYSVVYAGTAETRFKAWNPTTN